MRSIGPALITAALLGCGIGVLAEGFGIPGLSQPAVDQTGRAAIDTLAARLSSVRWSLPIPATTFGHLDSTIVLSRDIASLGIYPAVDPLDSTSRQLDPLVVGLAGEVIRLRDEHRAVARVDGPGREAGRWG